MLSDYSFKGRLLRALLARRGAAVVHMADAAGRRDLALIRETHALAPLLVQDASALQLLAGVRAAHLRGEGRCAPAPVRRLRDAAGTGGGGGYGALSRAAPALPNGPQD